MHWETHILIGGLCNFKLGRKTQKKHPSVSFQTKYATLWLCFSYLAELQREREKFREKVSAWVQQPHKLWKRDGWKYVRSGRQSKRAPLPPSLCSSSCFFKGRDPEETPKSWCTSLTFVVRPQSLPHDNLIITASWENKKTFRRNWQRPSRSDMCSSARPWQSAWEPWFWWWVKSIFCIPPAGCSADHSVQGEEDNRNDVYHNLHKLVNNSI